jgi:hypothetical protein
MDHEGQIEALTFEIHAKVDGNKFSFRADVVWFDGILEGEQRKATITAMKGNKFYFTASQKNAAE